MTEQTKIEWADSTFNPWEGCTKVGPGCDHCYAENRNARFGGGAAPNWGPGAPRRRTSEANWRLPVRWNAEPFMQCRSCGWRGERRAAKANAMMLPCPVCNLSTLLPTRRRVFCASLADVFDNEVDPAWRRDLFDLIRITPNLNWLLVTKRIGNAAAMVEEALAGPLMPANWPFPPPPPERLPRNVWLLITVCNQPEADRDIQKLLAIDAAVHGLSMEPLLGAVDLTNLSVTVNRAAGQHLDALRGRALMSLDVGNVAAETHRIDWVIAGGESGPGARPSNPAWFRSLRDQCAAASVPFLFKQWGEFAPLELTFLGPDDPVPLDATEFIETAPNGRRYRGSCVSRVGKKTAGRELDGRTHDGYPEVPHA